MIVLDASAAVEWLLRLPRSATVERSMLDGDIHVPHLLGIEVAQAVRRLTLLGVITALRGAVALEDLADLDAVRHPHEPLLPLVWDLRSNLTAYDATYVALAEVLDAPLVTLDAKLAAAPGNDAQIVLIS